MGELTQSIFTSQRPHLPEPNFTDSFMKLRARACLRTLDICSRSTRTEDCGGRIGNYIRGCRRGRTPMLRSGSLRRTRWVFQDAEGPRGPVREMRCGRCMRSRRTSSLQDEDQEREGGNESMSSQLHFQCCRAVSTSTSNSFSNLSLNTCTV